MHELRFTSLLLFLVGLLTAAASACAPPPCTLGSEACSCTQGGGCDPGLVCASDVCVELEPQPGDGDGDEEVDGGACAGGACSTDGGPVGGDGDEEVDGGACVDGACSTDGGPVGGDGDGDGDVTDGGTAMDGGDGDACDPLGEGCPCEPSIALCSAPTYCSDELLCVIPVCGNGLTEPGEACDDGNVSDADTCLPSCTRPEVAQVATGFETTCIRTEGGRVRCWGIGGPVLGLGIGYGVHLGDDELPTSVDAIALPTAATSISVGANNHACILNAEGEIYCWGSGSVGKIGGGNPETIGDDEYPNLLPPVFIGPAVTSVRAGGTHTCAILVNGKLRCFGSSLDGQLGYGNAEAIGETEPPISAGDVSLGFAAAAVALGHNHTCALGVGGLVRCWGAGGFGQLGYGNPNNLGAAQTPSSVGPVEIVSAADADDGVKPTALALGSNHSCALLSTQEVKCWGGGANGQLGQGDTARIGDDELPSTVDPIALPGAAVAITAGKEYACALLASQEVACWGLNDYGQLGYGHTETIGDDELPSTAGTVDLPAPVVQVAAGLSHTCALLETGELYCWGSNFYGELGYGHADHIGDDEAPTASGPVPLF